MTEHVIESILLLSGVAILTPVVLFGMVQVLTYFTRPRGPINGPVTRVKVTYEGICLPATDQPDETKMTHYDWSVIARISDENKHRTDDGAKAKSN